MSSLLPLLQIPRWLAAILIGLGGAWIGMLAGGTMTVGAGPFDVRLSASVGSGVTEIALPPLGSLSADTHVAPLRLGATLVSVDPGALSDFVSTRSLEDAVAEVERDLLAHISPFAVRVLAASLLGALAVGFLAFRTDWWSNGIAVFAALVIVGGAQLLAWQTYSAARLLSPSFSGPLALAPQLIGPAETAVDRINNFRGELQRIVAGVGRVFAGTQSDPVANGDELRVLHISDIHLSPLGLDLASHLADAFDVHFIVDTGDLTSFGSPAEDVIASFVPRFERPYVFVRGNHDSTSFQDAMEGARNAIVLDGTTTELEGLSIYGIGDVFFTPDRRSLPGEEEQQQEIRLANARILSNLGRPAQSPDVVVIHNDEQARSAAGRVPLVISGHGHLPSADVLDGTLFLRAGSTGGSGAEVFAEVGGVPLSAQILYFQRETRKLLAYDLIQQFPETGNITLERHLISQEFGEFEPVPIEPPADASTSWGRSPTPLTARPGRLTPDTVREILALTKALNGRYEAFALVRER
jgi:predicted phosphodiesterase